MSKIDFVAISGGFDPVHWGHVKMIADAARHGPVMVIVNSDDWLKRKKGYVFMPWKERAYILVVTAVDDSDGTVCEALIRHRPSFFANGGDRKQENTPEMEICEDLGIHMLWNVGGHKIQSSSDLVESTKIIGDDDVSTF